MENFPFPPPNEEESPFGLRVGEHMTWNGLSIERQAVLGPNWNYIVVRHKKTYRVNVFRVNHGLYRILIQGEWRGSELDTFIREDIQAESPEDGLMQALTRVAHLGPDGKNAN
jgi:hypothetical protein